MKDVDSSFKEYYGDIYTGFYNLNYYEDDEKQN